RHCTLGLSWSSVSTARLDRASANSSSYDAGTARSREPPRLFSFGGCSVRFHPLRTDLLKETLVGWVRRPVGTRAQTALVAGGAGFICVVLLFVFEAMLLFGTVNPGQISLLRSYADIPARVTE